MSSLNLNLSLQAWIFSQAKFPTAQACGPVRYDPSSSIDEIVVLVGAKVFIFNLDHSFWVAGEFSMGTVWIIL